MGPLLRPARGLVRRVRPARRRTWQDAALWSSRARLRGWLADDVLSSRVLIDGLGEEWARRTRQGFLQDEWRATRKTLVAAAPIALQEALRELADDGGQGT
jgi:hypothetical protein